jgi:hypothetical protein
MNKVVNSLSLITLLLWSFFAIGSINDLNFSVYFLKSLPFITEIVYALTVVVLLLGLLRIKRRWEALKDMKSFSKFIYTTRLSKKSVNLSTIFCIAEFLFMSFFVFMSINAQQMDQGTLLLPMFATLGFFMFEILVFIFKFRSDKNVKIGVNQNLIAYCDREMHIYYFDGLQQVSVYQNRLHLKYKKELHMFIELDIIPADELPKFKAALDSVLQDKPLFFDETYREMVKVNN